jgi:SAM-dependent methyltransferase
MQGDMRDLSALADLAFDVVWNAHSLGFVPDLNPVFDGLSRVLRIGGTYHVSCWNPLLHGAGDRWTGQGYLLANDYAEGAEVMSGDGFWDAEGAGGYAMRAAGPREFRHTLTAVLNGLIDRGFVLLDVREESLGNAGAEPGTWEHFGSILPPWLHIWARKRPDLLTRARE